jgi:predicted phosphohydrolase
MRKHNVFCEKNGIKTISFLFNNAYKADGFIIAGTRGWYHDEDASNVPDNTDFEKLTKREAQRLMTSLKEAERLREDNPECETVVFTHFPPFWNGAASQNIMNVLHEFSVKRLYYGHIHGNYSIPPTFVYEGIEMSIISADYLEFTPKFVNKS